MQKFADQAAPAAVPTTANSTKAADEINAHNTVTATALVGVMKEVTMMLDGMLRQLPQELSYVLAPKPTPKSGAVENSGTQVVETRTVIAAPQISKTLPSAGPASIPPSNFRAQRYRDGSMSLFETSGGRTTRKPILLTIRTPLKPQTIHTHPSPEYRAIDLHTVRDQATDAIYAVSDELARDLVIEGKIKMAHVCMALTMTEDGVVFLWPVDLSPGSLRTSSLAAIQMASEHHIKVCHDENGCSAWQRAGSWREPPWPSVTVAEVVEAAFVGRVISSMNHPVLWKIRNYRKSR